MYNSVIDKMLNVIKVRFSQDIFNIQLMYDIQTISDTFSLSFDQLNTVIRLFTQIDDIPSGSNNSTITRWLNY